MNQGTTLNWLTSYVQHKPSCPALRCVLEACGILLAAHGGYAHAAVKGTCECGLDQVMRKTA